MGFNGSYPLVNFHITMERSTVFNGTTHYKWPCSIAFCKRLPEGISSYPIISHLPSHYDRCLDIPVRFPDVFFSSRIMDGPSRDTRRQHQVDASCRRSKRPWNYVSLLAALGGHGCHGYDEHGGN